MCVSRSFASFPHSLTSSPLQPEWGPAHDHDNFSPLRRFKQMGRGLIQRNDKHEEDAEVRYEDSLLSRMDEDMDHSNIGTSFALHVASQGSVSGSELGVVSYNLQRKELVEQLLAAAEGRQCHHCPRATTMACTETRSMELVSL